MRRKGGGENLKKIIAMKYTYAYKTSNGARHEAAMEAESREAVFAALRARGIKAIKVVAADGSKANGEVRDAAAAGGEPRQMALAGREGRLERRRPCQRVRVFQAGDLAAAEAARHCYRVAGSRAPAREVTAPRAQRAGVGASPYIGESDHCLPA